MFRNIEAGIFVFVLTLVSTSIATAQDDLLGELYGRGVHSYYAGDHSKAHTRFTAAIDQGSRDPRCYYFRGLAYTRLGRPEDAVKDFKKGAQLEVEAGDFYPIGRSLERVQGRARLQLEDERQMARLAVRARQQNIERARYEQFQEDEAEVLRTDQPMDVEVPDIPTVTDVPAGMGAGDPFGGDGLGEGAMEEAEPDVPDDGGAADPFGGDVPMGGDDPFGGAGGDDPFGGAAPAGGADDPFGGGAGAGGADDPFGGGGMGDMGDGAMPAGDAAAPPMDDGDELGDPFANPPPVAVEPENAAPAPANPPPAAAPAMPAMPPGGDNMPDDNPFGGEDPFS